MMTENNPDVRHPAEGQREAAEERCPCGKPASHLQLPEDDRDWACLVPNFDPATGVHLPPMGQYAPSATDSGASADAQEQLAAHAVLLDQPTWTGRRYYAPDLGNEGAVVYLWDAPTPEGLQLEVTLQQHRLLTLTTMGVDVEDEAAVVHCDAGDLWLSPDDARAFAAALVACADRLDGPE